MASPFIAGHLPTFSDFRDDRLLDFTGLFFFQAMLRKQKREPCGCWLPPPKIEDF